MYFEALLGVFFASVLPGNYIHQVSIIWNGLIEMSLWLWRIKLLGCYWSLRWNHEPDTVPIQPIQHVTTNRASCSSKPNHCLLSFCAFLMIRALAKEPESKSNDYIGLLFQFTLYPFIVMPRRRTGALKPFVNMQNVKCVHICSCICRLDMDTRLPTIVILHSLSSAKWSFLLWCVESFFFSSANTSPDTWTWVSLDITALWT